MSWHIPGLLLAIPRNPVTALGLPLALGIVSGLPSKDVAGGQWYKSLTMPPGGLYKEVFPVAWSVLYISMGWASHLAVQAFDAAVFEPNRNDISFGLALYYGQLGLNALWSPLFFGQKKIGLALIDCVLLTGTTYCMTNVLDAPTRGQTTWFLLPYCAWLTYATYLNGGIWWLNRNSTGSGPGLGADDDITLGKAGGGN